MKCPFYDMSVEEKQEWMAKEYEELQKVNEDGIDFAGKTASMIAYERMLESEKPCEDRLFNDHLAKYFAEPYGKRVSEMLALGLTKFFDPDNEIGLEYEGHVQYTPARTQLINDFMTSWIANLEGDKQVVELGAGFTTRPFWVESLRNVQIYFEVDTRPINDFKNKVIQDLETKDQLTTPFCDRRTVSIDFSQESVTGLLEQGFTAQTPTCWILEGIVMYLSEEKSSALLRNVSDLSPTGSLMILNFFATNPSSDPDKMEVLLEGEGWSKFERLYFGEEKFNYGKYPEGKPANKFLGFCILKKN